MTSLKCCYSLVMKTDAFYRRARELLAAEDFLSEAEAELMKTKGFLKRIEENLESSYGVALLTLAKIEVEKSQGYVELWKNKVLTLASKTDI